MRDLTLYTKFQKFGEIKGVSVLCDKMTRVSKEIGFVQFSRAEQVEHCIAQMNFRTYMGRELYLLNKDKFQEVLKKQTTYIVTNLPQQFSNSEFRKFLESFGEVVVSELFYTKVQNQLVVDYGKVSFMTEESGRKFLEEHKNFKLEGLELEVRDFNMKDLSKMRGFNLIATNFPPGWGREEIKAFLKDRLPEIKEENMNIS